MKKGKTTLLSPTANVALLKVNAALQLKARQHQRMEAALRDSEALYHSLVDTLPINIVRKDLAGKVTFGNRHYCQTIGKALAEVMGKTDFDLFPKHLAEKYVHDDRKVIETGDVFEDIEEHQKLDGTKLYVHVLKGPVLNAHKEVVGTQVIFWDVTERKKAEEQLRQAYADLQKTNEALKTAQLQLMEAEKMLSIGRLASGVAHEVKNPLAIIGLGLDYLNHNLNHNEPDTAGILDDMQNALRRADAIIQGLLTFSAPSQLQLIPGSLNQVIEQALALVEHEQTGQEIIVVRELSPDLPLVPMDPNKITQVFVNLLSNAYHAMAKGGKLTVRTLAKQLQENEINRDIGSRSAERLHAGETVVVAEVDDTGGGINADILPRIFDPFFTTKPTGKGAGLGLTVSRKIMELHCGAIELQNRKEGGVRALVIFKG